MKSSHEKDLAPAIESEGKSKTKDLVEDNEKKIKGQKEGKEEEIVYLTDEDIEDLLK